MELPVSEKKPVQQAASPPPEAAADWQTRVFNWLPTIAFIFLTLNSVDSAYRCRHDPSALAFVLFAYTDLVSLFFCLRSFERLGPDSSPERRGQLKTAVWVLATALNLAFSWRVAAVMPPVLAVIVWVMSGSVAIGGFYGLFIYREADGSAVGRAYSAVKTTTEASPELKV